MADMNPLDYFLNPNKRIYWGFLLVSLCIALIFLWLNPQARRVNFSRKLWLHPSALLDYGYFLFASVFKVLVILPILIGAKEAALGTHYLLLSYYGLTKITVFSHGQVIALFTLSLFLINDFTRYWLHRFLHTVPWLWQFHQVHHSAKVLNPLTFYRVHPFESLLFGLRYSLSVGLVSGVFLYLFGGLIGVVDILGVNAIVFVFSLVGANLRHSHIPLGFGYLEKLIISPHQHQIHHSQHHPNVNFGGSLAVWDWVFGTLILSKNVGKLKFGLNANKDNFQSLSDLLFYPFIKIFKK